MQKEFFVERKQYSDIIAKRILGLKEGYRQNLAIIGDELIGKTSLISKFINRFYDSRIIMLYVSVQPEPLDSFTRRFIGVLLYNFLSASSITLKEDLEFLIEKSSLHIPKTIKKINSIFSALKKAKKNDIFSELFSLTEAINQETGKFCVVILDEFHNLEKIGIKNLYREWSNLLILQKNTMYIIVSSLKYKTKAVLSKELSLLFGNFETITIEPFDIKTSEFYLQQRLMGLNLNRKGLKDFIIYFTGGHPFYLKVITEHTLTSGQIHLPQLFEELLFDSSGILNQKFSNYIKQFLDSNHSQDYISILHLIANGNNKQKTVAHILRKSKNELDVKILRLLELDTLTKSGDFLKINDRVFGFWLKFVYQEKLHSLTPDTAEQRNLFRNNIEKMIKEFLLNSQKPITEIMSELLALFENELVQIETKRLKLAHFREIMPFQFDSGNLKWGILGRASDALWIIAFKTGCLLEDDIAVFSRECKKYRHSLQKKIIISFEGIDINARLKALEEKIWAWDLNHLNQLLDLFSKPRVIV